MLCSLETFLLKAKGKVISRTQHIAVLNLLIEPWNGVHVKRKRVSCVCKFPDDYLLRTRCISHETTNMRTIERTDTIVTTVWTLGGVDDAR